MNVSNRWYLLIPGLILLGLVLWYFYPILVYIGIAAVLSLIGRPILRVLDRVKIRHYFLPDSIKAIITLLFMYGVASCLFVLLIPPILEQSQNLRAITQNADQIKHGLEEPLRGIQTFLSSYGFMDEEASFGSYFSNRISSVLNAGNLSSVAQGILGFTGDFLIGFFSITFISFFFLKERELLHKIILMLTPEQYLDKVTHILTSSKVLLSRYFIGVIAEVALVGSLIGIGLFILGVEHALVIGFFAGIFNVIPYLGPILGAVLGASLALLGCLDLDFYSYTFPLLLKVLVVFLVVQLIDNFVFQPYIYSSSVKAHPLEIFLVILAAGSLAGVVGMILAIPVYTILRVIGKEFFNQFRVVQSITKSI
ncbi:MAG: AI-2E family transporter [Bacteroidota bacterium]